MRLRYPTSSGDRTVFVEQFLSPRATRDNFGSPSSGAQIGHGRISGYVTYFEQAQTVEHVLAFLIEATVDVTSNLSDQVVSSMGDGTTTKWEVGIGTTRQAYVRGASQSLVGNPISVGKHTIGWWIQNDGTVNVYVDGASVGSTSITFGSLSDAARLIVGASTTGGSSFSDTIYDVRITAQEGAPAPEMLLFSMTEQAQSWYLLLDSGATGTIDWGDGTPVDNVVGTDLLDNYTHNYAVQDTYVVTIALDSPGTLREIELSNNGGVGALPSMEAYSSLERFVADNNLFETYNPRDIPLTVAEWDVSVNALEQSAVDNILEAFARDVGDRPAAADIYLSGGSNLYPSEAGDAALQTIYASQPAWNIEATIYPVGVTIDVPVPAAPFDDGAGIACSGTYDSYWQLDTLTITYDGATVPVDSASNGVWSHTLSAVYGSNDISVEATYNDARTANDSVTVNVAQWAKGINIYIPSGGEVWPDGYVFDCAGTVLSPAHVTSIVVEYNGTYPTVFFPYGGADTFLGNNLSTANGFHGITATVTYDDMTEESDIVYITGIAS